MNKLTIPACCFLLFFCLQLSAQKPDESRFTVRTLATNFDEPMELTTLPGGKVLFVERKGKLKLYDPELEDVFTVAEIPCNTKYVNAQGHEREAEEGLMGIVADPDFAENHWIYIFYSDPHEPKHMLTRWDFVDDQLLMDSRKVLLEFPTQRQECCHTGGGMDFGPDGNLYITIGNNTSNGGSGGFSPLDERLGREPWDDQRGAGNTNDLRGSVLRIKPLADGTYAIPEGNLFPVGTPLTRPEIYTKGSRNPWRPTIDSHTGYLYWGEVGPDAPKSTEMGPAGYDEFNQAKKAGFFGWPYFAGNNEPYRDYDFATGEKGELFSLDGPTNDSPNNTGLRKLPPPTPAFIWYPYDISDKFPELGVSGRSATGVAVFHQDDFSNPQRLWPAYYEGKLFISDFMRGWIMSVTMDENSDYVSMERFMPDENFSSLIDMEFGESGDLYFLKYGTNWFGAAENSGLFRVEYNGGNRPPVAKISADRNNGALPLQVEMSAEGAYDPDGDNMNYQWSVRDKKKVVMTSAEANPIFNFQKPGEYEVVLRLSDTQGSFTEEKLLIRAGNTAPEVEVVILKGNNSFYFPGEKVTYEVTVRDKEDGNLDFSEILPSQVAVNVDYMPESFDPVEISSNYATNDTRARFNTGFKLISKNDCGSCHLAESRSIGPSYLEIADKYHQEGGALDRLAAKVITGGEGVWGDHAMSAHPQLSEQEAKSMVSYILSFAEEPLQDVSAPISGEKTMEIPESETGFGGYVFRAAYEDQGARKVPSILTENIRYLSYPFLDPRNADFKRNTENVDTPTHILQFFGPDSYIGFKSVDLTGIKGVDLLVQASSRTFSAAGELEIRIDRPDGPLIGKTIIQQMDRGDPVESKERDMSRKIYTEQAYRMAQGAAEYFLGVSQVIPVELKEISGNHDLYFVPVSPKAKANQIIFSFSGIEFRN